MENFGSRNSSHSTQDGTTPPTVVKASPTADGREKTEPSPATRVACDACRERKIRCNRHRPVCGRCVKLGITCRYSSRSTSTPSKLDLSRILTTLNKRLQQAEAQIATQTSISNASVGATSWSSDLGSLLNLDSSCHSSSTDLYDLGVISEKTPAMHNMMVSPDQTTVNFLDFPFDTYTSEMSVDQIENMLPNPIQNGTQMIYPETMLVNSIPTSLHQTMPELSNGLVQRLHDICFDIYRPMMGMVDQIRFETELSHPTPTIQVQALSYAIAALGALSVPELHCHVSNCYQQSRNLLDLCEREETGESLSNINTLQACTLLTIYELKQPNFRRAWMSLGRTTRLAQMMGLGQSDGRPASVMTPQWSGPSPTPSLHNPVKTEEMRRTFWVLYILDGFASIITQSGVAFDQEINIPLPGRDVTIQEVVNNTDVTMPSLNVIFDPDVAGRVQISSLAGVVIMTHLYQRIVNHMNSSHNASHNFWEVHYDINKSIELCRNTLMVEHLTNNSDDPVAVALRMSMNTVDIMLHESALLRVHKEVLPVFLANDAISRCTTAVKDIIDALQMGQLLPGRKLESFQQLNNFHTWPITSAIQTCCRFLQMRCDNMSLYIYAIRVLSTSPTTKALVDENLIYGGLIEKANAMATEAEKSIPAS